MPRCSITRHHGEVPPGLQRLPPRRAAEADDRRPRMERPDALDAEPDRLADHHGGLPWRPSYTATSVFLLLTTRCEAEASAGRRRVPPARDRASGGGVLLVCAQVGDADTAAAVGRAALALDVLLGQRLARLARGDAVVVGGLGHGRHALGEVALGLAFGLLFTLVLAEVAIGLAVGLGGRAGARCGRLVFLALGRLLVGLGRQRDGRSGGERHRTGDQ